ncbi:MAG: class I SAM-dependent methyltransferase [Polyangiales bacterium]
MGVYREHILPRVTEWILDQPAIERRRAVAVAPLQGEIVELGFGAGLNLPVLPKQVTRVNAIDPDQVGRRLAATRIGASSAEVRFAGLDGERIALDDASMDGALSTFTLCSIPDPVQALREVRRVLRPGAPLAFLEHGIAEAPHLIRWQRRINAVYSPIAGGCRLDLDVADALRAAGFTHVTLERSLLGKKPGLTNHLFRGVAYAP